MSEEEKPTEKKTEPVPDPDLDSLLDDALQDFTTPQPPTPETQATDDDLATAMAALGVGAAAAGSSHGEPIWTEEFIQKATSNFEKTMRSMMEQNQGNLRSQQQPPSVSSSAESTVKGTTAAAAASNASLLGGIDMATMTADFAKYAREAAKSGPDPQGDLEFTQYFTNTMKQLSKNSDQLKSTPTHEEMMQILENVGKPGVIGEEGDGGPLSGLHPLMQSMLENILSKEVLYPPIKEIADKYPDWLADQRSTLSEEEYNRYNKQYDVMKRVVDLYEEEQESDADEIKSQRFEKVMESMQKLQEMGQPPKDLVGDLDPMIQFDEAGNPVLPDLTTFFGGAFPGPLGEMPTEPPAGFIPTSQGPNAEQCSVM